MRRLALLAVASLLLAGCASSEAPIGDAPIGDDGMGVPLPMPVGPEQPILLVAPQASGGDSALIEGTLGVNAVNCVTLDDALLVAPFGSTIEDSVIAIAAYGSFAIGDEVSLGGGLTEELPIAEVDGAYLGCVPGEADTVSIVFVAPRAR